MTGAGVALIRGTLSVTALHFALCTLVLAQGAPKYSAELLRCAAFSEEVRTTVDARRGMEGWQERGLRHGVLQVRATPGARALSFEAWYDSLTVDYSRPDAKVTPDTDGLIGGRWLGTMLPHGEVALTDRPFMPPELAQVSDLSDQMLDFFPPLATAALAPGGHWTDSLGLEVDRPEEPEERDRRVGRLRRDDDVLVLVALRRDAGAVVG